MRAFRVVNLYSSFSSAVPSWMVRAIGLRVKSGWFFPSGISSTNCTIITPGTLDFFLISTVKKRLVTICYPLKVEKRWQKKDSIPHFKIACLFIIELSPTSTCMLKYILIQDIRMFNVIHCISDLYIKPISLDIYSYSTMFMMFMFIMVY